jgi:hypothetical protein
MLIPNVISETGSQMDINLHSHSTLAVPFDDANVPCNIYSYTGSCPSVNHF